MRNTNVFSHQQFLHINPMIIYASCIACSGLFTILFFITNYLLKQTFNMKNRELRVNFASRVVSSIHAIISTTCALLLLFLDNEIYLNELIYKSYGITTTLTISIGYFTYDFLMMIILKEVRDYTSMFHHMIATLAFHGCIIRGGFALIAITRLTSELSTPFINNRWFLLNLNKKNSKMFVYNGYIIIILFLLCRILPIMPLWQQFYKGIGTNSWNSLTLYDISLCIITNVPLDVLNLYWFSKIIQGCIKNLSKPKSV